MPCPPRARSVAHMAPCIADRGHLPPRPPFCSACVCARPYVDIYARPRRRCRARGSSSIDHAVCARHVPRRLTMYACAWSHGDRITRMRTLLYVRAMLPKPYLEFSYSSFKWGGLNRGPIWIGFFLRRLLWREADR